MLYILYTAPSVPIYDLLTKLDSDLKEIKPYYLIIGGDTNAKSSLWFSSTNNRRGDELVEFIVQNNLTILNNSSKPTFMSSFGQSNIDLTLVNTTTQSYK